MKDIDDKTDIDYMTEAVMMVLGEWLRRKRKARRMTQKALGEELSCHAVWIGKWENGVAALPMRVFLKVCMSEHLDPKYEMAKIFVEAGL